MIEFCVQFLIIWSVDKDIVLTLKYLDFAHFIARSAGPTRKGHSHKITENEYEKIHVQHINSSNGHFILKNSHVHFLSCRGSRAKKQDLKVFRSELARAVMTIEKGLTTRVRTLNAVRRSFNVNVCLNGESNEKMRSHMLDY